MPPQAVTSPERRFVLTRVDGGTETNVAVSTLLAPNFTTDAPVRTVVYSNAASLRAANPTIHYRLYGPTNGGAHTDGDCIWDSTINGPLV